MEPTYDRPFEPTSIEADTLRGFPLSEMTEQLKTERAFRDSGRDSLTLVHGPDLTLVLTVVRGGTACDEHRSPGPAAIVVLSGTLVLSGPDTDAFTVLPAGSMVAVGPGLVHVLAAENDAAYLTVIGRQTGMDRGRGRDDKAAATGAGAGAARRRRSPSRGAS